MACHPSGASRSSQPARSAKSSSYGLDAVGQIAVRIVSTVDNASGDQKTACWSNACSGSAAKRQPPLPSEAIRRAGLFAPEGLEVCLILTIAA